MKLILSPSRNDTPIELYKQGDSLIINEEVFDFSPLPEGSILPKEAIQSNWFSGPVERKEGELIINLLLPHGPNAPQQTLFPEHILAYEDGKILLPPYDYEDDNFEN